WPDLSTPSRRTPGCVRKSDPADAPLCSSVFPPKPARRPTWTCIATSSGPDCPQAGRSAHRGKPDRGRSVRGTKFGEPSNRGELLKFQREKEDTLAPREPRRSRPRFSRRDRERGFAHSNKLGERGQRRSRWRPPSTVGFGAGSGPTSANCCEAWALGTR